MNSDALRDFLVRINAREKVAARFAFKLHSMFVFGTIAGDTASRTSHSTSDMPSVECVNCNLANRAINGYSSCVFYRMCVSQHKWMSDFFKLSIYNLDFR